MGHYGADDRQKQLPRSDMPVFDTFKSHCSGLRVNTELTVLESIRYSHPDKHITPVYPHVCSLLSFAKAGRAEATLVTEGDGYEWHRNYTAPGSRLEGGPGKLSDGVDFGRYEYAWSNTHFEVYDVQWDDEYQGHQAIFYILSSKRDLETHHSRTADSLISACGKWTSELHEEIYVFDAGCWIKNKQLYEAVQTASWDDVILDPAMKDTLINDVHSFFDSREVYQEYSVPWKRGIIMHGTPGCGKTISIKALMNSLQEKDVASLYVKSFKTCRGMEYSIRTIFAQARIMAPCLLIFEDLDSLVEDEVRSYFLNEVDGLESNDGILMIGSTNHLERLDPGISKRPSRFDRKYHYKLPGHTERVLYCQYWREKLQKHRDLGFSDDVCDIVAKLTEDFSFAYMKELFVQALLAIVGGRSEDDDLSNDVAISDAAEKTEVVEESAKLVKEGEKTESATTKAAGDESAEKKAETKKPAPVPRKVPEVEIPEHLRSNALLRILKKQVIALVKDMDNTEEDGEDTPPKQKIAGL